MSHDPLDSLLTPAQLNENPQIAALWVLRTSLEVAQSMLLATYPQSGEREERHSTEEEAYAIALLYQIDAVAALLDEYVESISRRAKRLGQRSSEEDIPF